MDVPYVMYVNCTKLSFPQTAGIFDNRLVVDQLRACGIVETIKIRQTGYPIRHLFIDFVKRWDEFWDAPRMRESSPLLVSDSLRASSPIWSSEASRARTRERVAKPRGAEESRALPRVYSPLARLLLRISRKWRPCSQDRWATGASSLHSRKSPFACYSRVTSHDFPKWRGYSQAKVLLKRWIALGFTQTCGPYFPLTYLDLLLLKFGSVTYSVPTSFLSGWCVGNH